MLKLHKRNRRNPPDVQCRRLSLAPDELRFTPPATSTDPFRFEGYAVKWGTVNSHNERFEKGAFSALIASGKKVHMYYNHGYLDWFSAASAHRIGKWLELVEDDIGLLVKGELTPRLSLAEEVGAMLQHGTVDGLSIAFYEPNPMDMLTGPLGETVIIRVDAYEISVVDEPSDRTARITPTGEAISSVNSTRDAADLLQALGLSSMNADLLLARLDDVLHKPEKTAGLKSVLDALPA